MFEILDNEFVLRKVRIIMSKLKHARASMELYKNDKKTS